MKFKALLYLPTAVLLLSACTYDFTTAIEPDGSGEFTIHMAVTAQDIDSIEEEADEDFEDVVWSETGEDSIEDACYVVEDEFDIPGTDVEFQDRDGGYTCTVTIPFDDIDELIQIYEDIGLAEDLRIRMNSSGELAYRLDLDMFGVAAEDVLFFDELEMRWNLRLPGRITDHNAEQRRGRTLTWDMLTGDAVIRIDAESVPASFNWLLYGAIAATCLCALALLAGGAGFFLYSRKKNTEA